MSSQRSLVCGLLGAEAETVMSSATHAVPVHQYALSFVDRRMIDPASAEVAVGSAATTTTCCGDSPFMPRYAKTMARIALAAGAVVKVMVQVLTEVAVTSATTKTSSATWRSCT